jgi:hypothetical protein
VKKLNKQGGNVAIDTVPLPEQPATKRKRPRGSVAVGTWPTPERPATKRVNGAVAIDTVPLPERNARLAAKMLRIERQLGKLVAAATSTAGIVAEIAPMRKCAFRPHYRAGMTQAEGAQATCDAIEAFLDCLAGKSGKPE